MGMEMIMAFLLFRSLREVSIISDSTSFSLNTSSSILIKVRAKKSFIVTESVTVDLTVSDIVESGIM